MDTLEQNEYIKSVKTSSNIIFYQITEKGIEAYSQWIKATLLFIRERIAMAAINPITWIIITS
jgi:DNA-binding PadR family transcriptional regulator